MKISLALALALGRLVMVASVVFGMELTSVMMWCGLTPKTLYILQSKTSEIDPVRRGSSTARLADRGCRHQVVRFSGLRPR
jgi:hypothetical protein